jgi:hypothetical protein
MKTDLNNQMLCWATRLINDLKLNLPEANNISTTISNEVRSLSTDMKKKLVASSPISPKDRLEELVAFQGWMDYAHNIGNNPFITRAQVITQNYICFVYLGDGLFKALQACLPVPKVTGRICRFLLNNPVRAFRNAIAHSNWRYLSDFSGIEFWSKKGSDPDEQPVRFEVLQNDLNYWQALARCTAYSAFMALDEQTG